MGLDLDSRREALLLNRPASHAKPRLAMSTGSKAADVSAGGT